jgi:hypothetical protein
MPVDHDRKLLFIHIPKTGGTTILTLLGLWNKQRAPDFQKLFGDFGTVDLQHLTLAQTAQFLTPQEFASYFRFAFVRNPWDRAVSAAQWRTKFPEAGVRDLRDFVDWAERVNRRGAQYSSDTHALPQSEFLAAGGGVPGISSIGRFETFADDLRNIFGSRLALPAQLPHKLRRPDARMYRDYYCGDLRERVARLYAEDAARFGYTF